LTLPLKYKVPTVAINVFQSGSMSVPVDVLLMSKRTRPPAFQKYLACAALPNVTVWRKEITHPPVPTGAVLEILPVQVELVVPELVAYPRLVVTLLISVATLAKIATTLPVTGAVLEVNVVVV
jgi:hypothetical protein